LISNDWTAHAMETHRRAPISFAPGGGPERQRMADGVPNSVVHLELRTGNLACACGFYTRLFGWRAETIHTRSGDYTTVTLGNRIDGGVVEHDTQCAYWLPYVEVPDIEEVAERARRLGASVLVTPREGPAGWRSVLVAPDGGIFALWQPKA
jgi:predicted enzyme related to lactoylglutathione lyase